MRCSGCMTLVTLVTGVTAFTCSRLCVCTRQTTQVGSVAGQSETLWAMSAPRQSTRCPFHGAKESSVKALCVQRINSFRKNIPMMTTMQLHRRLRAAGIYVQNVKENPKDTIYNLYCGGQITLYTTTGTVVVRGKIKSYSHWDAVAALEQVLPRDTRWNHTTE